MKPFDVTISFRKNTAPMHRPPVWQECERIVRVFAPSTVVAKSKAAAQTGGCVVKVADVWALTSS